MKDVRLYRSLKNGVVVALCTACLALTQVGMAQAAQKVRVDIPAQDLSAALTQFGRETGTEIVFAPDAVREKKTGAVKGEFERGQALKMLLEGSGLTYRVTAQGAIVVEPSKTSAQVADTGPMRLSQIETDRMQKVAQQGEQSKSSKESEGSSSDGTGESSLGVVGSVTDITTGANLKGALVELEGTDRMTSTDDLGVFRFPGLRPGVYRVRISFLGYQDIYAQIEAGPNARPTRFAMVGGTSEAAIVVYGRRSARAQALNQERSAENVSTVISGDLLGAFTGTTVSDSLRRAPGVVFDRDPQTGEGSNVGIRGLSADLNMVTFNGIELPEGSGVGRSASLGNILTESIGSVTINKTLLPSMDSAGTGGLVEIVTKTPLDRPHRYASLTAEGARRAKGFNDEFLAAGTISGKFGSEDQLGLSASAQYREHSSRRISYGLSNSYGLYLPLQIDGTTSITTPLRVDPRLAFPFEEGSGQVYINGITSREAANDTTNLGITLSTAWAVSDATELFFDYQKLDQSSEDYSTNLLVNTTLNYTLRPVVALGGERRRALGPIFASLPGFITSTSSYDYTPDGESNTDIFTFRGESRFGGLKLNYGAGYTKGTTDAESLRVSLGSQNQFLTLANGIAPEALDPVEGRIISIFPQRMPNDKSFPDPLLTQQGFDIINELSNYDVFVVNHLRKVGENSRRTGNASARYDFQNGPLRYLEIGSAYKSSRFTDATLFENNYYPVANSSLDYFGLALTNSSLTDVGVMTQSRQLPRAAAIDFMRSVIPLGVDCPSNPTCPPGTPFRVFHATQIQDPRLLDEYTDEDELAAYVQGALRFGRFEAIGGVRMSRVKVQSANLQGPLLYDLNGIPDLAFQDANRSLLEEHAVATEFLPRLLTNFRYNDNLIFRLGYYLSVARPQIFNLSRTASASLFLRPVQGPNSNLPALLVFKGNPALKPARTHNFDFSAELYDSDAGVLKLGVFYKQISNLLETNLEDGTGVLSQVADILPDDPRFQDVLNNPDNYFIQISLPTNAESDARIWGIETSVEKQFNFLPGALSGLGVYANYTFADSSKDQAIAWSNSPVVNASGTVTGLQTVRLVVPDIRFDKQARHSGTAGLTYNKYGIDANVAYTWQARRKVGVNSSNLSLSPYEEAYGTLDTRFEYRFKLRPANVRVYLEGTDLLRGPSDSALLGTVGTGNGVTPKYYTSATYYGGREVRLGLSANF